MRSIFTVRTIVAGKQRPSASERLLTWLAATFPVRYAKYIRSAVWRRRATAAKVRAGWRCQVCAARDVVLDTHHNDYTRLGFESAKDLVVLCRTCHRLFHERMKRYGNQD